MRRRNSAIPVITKLICRVRTADYDYDGDLFDPAAYRNCFAGEGSDTCNPGCDALNLVPVNAIDHSDDGVLERLLTGPQ